MVSRRAGGPAGSPPGQVWSAKPVTIVCDRPDLVALWIAPGMRWKQPQRPDGGPVGVVDVLRDRWVLADAVWTGGGALILHTPPAAHALLGFWDERHTAVRSWYINLQAPLRRTPLGLDTLDHILDVDVRPDRSLWSWKDEDRLAEAEIRGLISHDTARAIRAEGERALQLLLAGEPPYAPEWEQWGPCPNWSMPTLPPKWETGADQS